MSISNLLRSLTLVPLAGARRSAAVCVALVLASTSIAPLAGAQPTDKAIPVAPSNLRADDIGQTDLLLYWNDNSGNEDGFNVAQLDEGENPANTAAWDRVAQTAANDTGVRITGLTAGTTYWYKVRAYDGADYSAYSNIIEVQTLPLPPAAPSNLRVTAVTYTTVDLAWNDNSGNESAFNIARLDPGEDPANPALWDQVGQVPANSTSFQATGLSPNSSYSFKVRAINAGGASSYSNIVVQPTPQVPPAAPTNLRASDLKMTSLILHWDDNATNEDGFNVSQLDEGENPDVPANWDQVATTNSNDTGIRIENLQRDSRYWFRVRAYNGGGYSAYTNTLEVQMPDGTPAAPSSLTVNDVNMTNLILHWQDNADDEDGFYVSRLDPGEDPANPVHWDQVATTTANDTGIRLEGMQPLTRYLFRVRAYNMYGNSAYSDTLGVKTIGPTSLNVYFDDELTIDTVTWNSGITSNYTVRIVAEDIIQGFNGWEARIPLPAGFTFDRNAYSLLTPGTVLGSSGPGDDPWWRVQFPACVHPDTSGQVPLVEFPIVPMVRPLLDTRLNLVGLAASSLVPAAAAFFDCADQPRPYDELRRGTINPSDPACVVAPWLMQCGYVALGDTSRTLFSVTNGDDNRTLSGVVRLLPGPDTDQFHVEGDSVYSLTPGQSQSFTLVYAPMSLAPGGTHTCRISLHDEPWHCETIDASGTCDDNFVMSLDPLFRRFSSGSAPVVGEPFYVWIGVAGLPAVSGWSGTLEIPAELTALDAESLIPVLPGSIVTPGTWDVAFASCQAVPEGGILPVGILTLAANQALTGAEIVVPRGPDGSGRPDWLDCAAKSVSEFTYANSVVIGDTVATNNRPIATPVASPSSGTVTLNVQFSANAVDTDAPATELRYFWMFGDGSYSVESNPAHSYREPGAYAVVLNIFDGEDDRDVRLTVDASPSYLAPAPERSDALSLKSAFPNPFNPRLNIAYSLGSRTPVSLVVHDLAGHLVATVFDGVQDAGDHNVTWDGRDREGHALPAGAYVVSLESTLGRQRRTVVLLR